MRILALLLLPLLLSLTPAQAQSRYEARDCAEIAAWLLEVDSEAYSCGLLHVPENRRNGAYGRMLELFVVRVAPVYDMGNPPVIYLDGGPGGAASAAAWDVLESALRQENELILIDQRGTGYSKPSLNCPEMDEAAEAGGDSAALQHCRNRLLVEGIDLSAYNSANNAWDVQDLLVAMDIDAANIYGISYGTRLALTLARDFPARLRALILDGVYPPQAQLVSEQGKNGQGAFDQLFKDCANSPACASAYPNLREQFNATVDKLNESPAEVLDWNTYEEREMDGVEWINYFFSLLYDSTVLPYLPAFIAAHADGDFHNDLAPFPGEDESDDWVEIPTEFEELDSDSEGMFHSVTCADEVAFDTYEAALEAGKELEPRMDQALTTAAIWLLDSCDLWNVPASHPREANAVHSDIPALLLSGAYDPITPGEWGALAARTLSGGWHYVFPAAGHGVLGSHACADLLLRSFLDDPTARPDDDCVDALRPPDFYRR